MILVLLLILFVSVLSLGLYFWWNNEDPTEEPDILTGETEDPGPRTEEPAILTMATNQILYFSLEDWESTQDDYNTEYELSPMGFRPIGDAGSRNLIFNVQENQIPTRDDR